MLHGWLNGRFKKPSAGGGEDSQSFSDWGYIVTGKTTRSEGMILVGGDASLTL